MRSFRKLLGLLLVIGASAAAGYDLSGLSQQAASGSSSRISQASAVTFPKDVYSETGNRLAPIKREELDEIGKSSTTEEGRERLSDLGESVYIVHPWPHT